MTNHEDIFPDTPNVRAFMDAVAHMNGGFIKAEEEMFKRYFIILTEDEPIAPYVIQSMSYESIMGSHR